MSACEPCWNRAYTQARIRGTSQVDEYRKLVAEADCPSHGDFMFRDVPDSYVCGPNGCRTYATEELNR